MREEPALDAFIESLHTHDLPLMLVLTDLAERQSSVITIRFFLHLGEMFVTPYDEYGLNVIKGLLMLETLYSYGNIEIYDYALEHLWSEGKVVGSLSGSLDWISLFFSFTRYRSVKKNG